GEKVMLRIQESTKMQDDRTLIAAADTSGNISSQLQQDGRNPEAKYILTATGSLSEGQLRFANTAANLDQCANGALATAPNPQTNTNCATSGDWVNGNLGSSKAHYLEGDSVPYRLRLTGLTAGT